MKIDIRIDKHIKGTEGIAAHITEIVERALSRFGNRISGVEVHLNDENGDKSSAKDKHCMMEAHLIGLTAAAVNDHAETFESAIKGASAKLKRAIESTVGRESTLLGRRDQK